MNTLNIPHFRGFSLWFGIFAALLATAVGGLPTNAQSFAYVPPIFEANQGQARKEVKFLARGSGYALFLTPDGMQLAFTRPVNHDPRADSSSEQAQQRQRIASTALLRMKLVGASATAKLEALEPLPGTVSYFVGADSKNWISRIPTYGSIVYKEIYPGIDAVFHGNAGEIEYDFVLSPNADPTEIQLQFTGAREIKLDANGDLLLYTANGEVRNRKPAIYQEIDGQRHEVAGHYVLCGKNRVSFSVANYARNDRLVIDPAIVYSTYLDGATSTDSWASGVAVFTDPVTGHVYAYIGGTTSANDFPVVNALKSSLGGASNAFVTKFDPAASGAASVVWSTYLGGSGSEKATGIAVDSEGNAFVIGWTHSTDFPTVNAYQTSLKFGNLCLDCVVGAQDAFVTKISAAGSALLYSSYFGGSASDTANAIALDPAGLAYIAGGTGSVDLPTVNAYQAVLRSTFRDGEGSSFLAIFDTTRTGPASLLYSTFFGGSGGPDTALAVAVDGSGAVHLGGFTTSSDFPIWNGLQNTPKGSGNSAAFYAKLNPGALGPAQLLYSTYLGGSGDRATGIALDTSGSAYLSGFDSSGLIPTTPGAYQTVPGPHNGNQADSFIAKINPSQVGLTSLVYSTLLPGLVDGAGPVAIAVNSNGNAFITGAIKIGLPLVNPVQNSSNGVFQSLNAGTTWTGLTQGLTDTPISALAVDTSTSPRTLYAGTGKYLFGGESIASGSIFASTDGGLNWNKVFQVPNGQSQTPTVFELAVDPTTPSNVYAGTTAGVFESPDRGATWSAFNNGLSTTAVQAIRALVLDGGTQYAGAADGLYKLSPGATAWTHTAQTVDVQYVALDPTTSPHTLYTGSYSTGAFKSADGGSTWTSIQPNSTSNISNIAIDTTSTPATIYGYDGSDPYLLKSTDAGNTWTILTDIGTEAELGAIALDTSTSPSIIYYASGGPIFKSTDGGATWPQIFRPNLLTAIALDPTTAGPTSPSTLYIAMGELAPSAFVAELNPIGSELLFSTYLGGIDGQAYGNAIAVDAADNIYIAGRTTSGYFPTVNAYQTVVSLPPQTGQNNAFLAKLGSRTLPQSSSGSVSTQLAVQTGTLSITFPDITGSTTSSAPTLTVTPLSSTSTANFSLSNNLGAFDISTTAVYSASTSQPVTLCFQAFTVNDPSTFAGLSLLHVINGVPVDVTSSRNFSTRTVCGAVTSFSPFILVKGALGQLQDIVRYVNESDLRKGIQTSLDAKLQNAESAFSSATGHDDSSVCNLMSAFINNVQAQTGNLITTTESAHMIAAANQVKATVSCTQ